jgi:hypothetical protein
MVVSERMLLVLAASLLVSAGGAAGAQVAPDLGLPREVCTREHIEDGHFLRCLQGDAGPLSDPERARLEAGLEARAATSYERVAFDVARGALLADPARRRVFVRLLVAHGLSVGAGALLEAMADPERELAAMLRTRRVPRRSRETAEDRRAIAGLTLEHCAVAVATSTDPAVHVECDAFVRCGPGACAESHAHAALVIDATGWHLSRAGIERRPSSGACGDCIHLE